jgi:hypothetical protein
MFITSVNDTGNNLFTGVKDTGDKFIASDKFITPASNPCHRFSVIAGVVDTGNKFLTGVNDTCKQLSPLKTTLAINLLPVTRTRLL